jgi:phage-related protein
MKNEYRGNASSNAVYGLGFIGSVIYFIAHATTFWIGVIGVLKSIVWPAILVYEALKHLGL